MPARAWISNLTFFTAFLTVILLAAGALVTGTGSGLAVPDWPLSFGQFFPPMVGGVLYEHGHRLIAGAVAAIATIQAVFLFKFDSRAWVRRLAVISVIVVFSQAALGGMTVLLRLPTYVSVAHACLAQVFFSIIVLLAWANSSYWETTPKPFTESENRGIEVHHFALGLSLLFAFQLLAGATMRHMGAGLAIPDFPAVFGGVIPPHWTARIGVHYLHRAGAFSLVFFVSWFAIRTMRRSSQRLSLVGLVGFLLSLLSFQFMLGAMVIWLRRPVPVTTLHLVTGALCLASSVVLSVECFRRKALSAATEPVGSLELAGEVR